MILPLEDLKINEIDLETCKKCNCGESLFFKFDLSGKLKGCFYCETCQHKEEVFTIAEIDYCMKCNASYPETKLFMGLCVTCRQ